MLISRRPEYQSVSELRHDLREARRGVRYIRSLDQIEGLDAETRRRLQPVAERFAFRVNDYYLSLIDWNDPQDPIRQLVIPHEEELNGWGSLDASNEGAVTVHRGVQHKYTQTALLLCNEVCGSYCRYCFRKRLFMQGNDEASKDVSSGLAYIKAHPEINNVLLTGGDPLLMSTRRLGQILGELSEIPHVRVIRIGSKMPAFDPFRFLNDHRLQEILRRMSTPRLRIYLMAHFDHPRELTLPAVEGLRAFLECGVICVNQCPLIRGVNDNGHVLARLYEKLSFIGCPPYYLFQGRPTAGNAPYGVPIVRGWRIFQEALNHGSGLARRARFVMSHASGKVEVVGLDEQRIYLRYHQARRRSDIGRFFACHRDDDAMWLDDLVSEDGRNFGEAF